MQTSPERASLVPSRGYDPDTPGGLCDRPTCPYGTPCQPGGAATALGAAPVPAFALCLVDKRVVWRNHRAATSDHVPLEVPFEALVDDADRRAASALVEAARGGDAAEQTASLSFMSSDARPQAFEATCAVVPVNHSSPRQMVVYLRRGDGDLDGLDGEGGSENVIARVSRLETALSRIAREAAWVGFGVEPRAQLLDAIVGVDLLNNRERDVVQLVASGMRVETIARRLFVSPSTVRNYLSSIYRKLGVSKHAELLELLLQRDPGTSL